MNIWRNVCFQLRSGGSQILEGCIAEIPNISSLDISDNSGDILHLNILDDAVLTLIVPVHDSVFVLLRFGHGSDHTAGLAGQESLHQTPFTGQKLQQHQVQVCDIASSALSKSITCQWTGLF